MVNTETGGIDSSIIADAAPDEKGAFFMPTAIISGGIQDFRRTIDQLPNTKVFPDFCFWISSSGEQLCIVEKISDNANRADWIIYPPSREFQFPDPKGRVAFFAIQYITGRAQVVCPPPNEVSSAHREFYRCFFDELDSRGLLIDPNDSCQSNTGKQAGGNGAGRKPDPPELIAAKRELLELTEKNRAHCRNYEEALAKAYEKFDDDKKWLLDTIPAWSTVRGWRNLPDE